MREATNKQGTKTMDQYLINPDHLDELGHALFDAEETDCPNCGGLGCQHCEKDKHVDISENYVIIGVYKEIIDYNKDEVCTLCGSPTNGVDCDLCRDCFDTQMKAEYKSERDLGA